MQTLWSRQLRQTKCTRRCRQCLSFSTAIARRATAAARKRYLALPSSTIFYSAIFACATVADGYAKQHRRDQWNSAIDGLKKDLNPGDAEGAEDEATPDKGNKEGDGRTISRKRLKDMDAEDIAEFLKKVAAEYDDPAAAEKAMLDTLAEEQTGNMAPWSPTTRHIFDDATEQEAVDWEDAQKYSMLQSARPEWTPNTGPLYNINNFPPQSLYASDSRKLEGLASPWSRRKIQTMNLSMAKLVLRIAWTTDLAAYPLLRRWNPTLPETWLPENIFWVAIKKPKIKEKFMQRIEDFLRFTKQPLAIHVPEFKPIFGKHPHYEQDADGEYHRKCHNMNRRIFEAFEECFQGKLNMSSLFGNVCEELLTASAPPNITTYNALILGFSRLKQFDLCDMVIDSMHEVHMRPDEITCTAALSLYIKRNDSRKFGKFVQLMTGMSNSNYALMLARPSLPIHRPRTFSKLGNRVLRHPRTPDKLIQKTHPSPRVMNTIVQGMLKFHGLERTLDICTAFLADGWGLDADGLTHFLHACAERQDWPAGLAVWGELQALRHQRPVTRPLDRHTYLQMLGLCWRCKRHDEFAEVLHEASEIAGYRAGALKKDFEKMRREGLSVFDKRAERRADWMLRFEMAAKFEAERRLVDEAARRARALEAERKADEEERARAAALHPTDTPPPAEPQPKPPLPPRHLHYDYGTTEAFERSLRWKPPVVELESEHPHGSAAEPPPDDGDDYIGTRSWLSSVTRGRRTSTAAQQEPRRRPGDGKACGGDGEGEGDGDGPWMD